MGIRRRVAALFTLSGILFSALVCVCFAAAPEVGSAYCGAVKPLGTDLPLLTRDFSLPMLRVEAGGHDRPTTGLWPGLVWAMLLLTPTALGVWSARAATEERALLRWAGGLSLLLPLWMLLAVAVLAGLALPFTCLTPN